MHIDPVPLFYIVNIRRWTFVRIRRLQQACRH